MNKLLILAVLLFVCVFGKLSCEHAKIHGATFGTNDITSKVAHMYNTGNKVIDANAALWGQTLGESTHVLSVFYEKCGNLGIVTALEGESVTLP